MTERGPTEKMRYLTADLAKEWGVTLEVLQPPRTISIPPQPELQVSPRMLPPVRARTRAVVQTLLGIGLPMKVGLLFSPTIIVIPEDATVNIEDRCQSRVGWAPWCLVSYQGKQGYVNGIYLRAVTERPPPRPEAKRARTRTDLNLRMAPDPRSSILREMPKDSDVIVGGCRRIDDGETWCRVLHDGALGWANRSYFDDVARTRTDLNLRIAPDHRSTILREMPEGSDVIVTGECRRSADGENWCRVTHDGISGWANASFWNELVTARPSPSGAGCQSDNAMLLITRDGILSAMVASLHVGIEVLHCRFSPEQGGHGAFWNDRGRPPPRATVCPVTGKLMGKLLTSALAWERGLRRTPPVFTGWVPSSSNRSDASSARLRASHEIGRPREGPAKVRRLFPGEPRRGRSGSLSLK
jgi:uncharacterized protein YraI